MTSVDPVPDAPTTPPIPMDGAPSDAPATRSRRPLVVAVIAAVVVLVAVGAGVALYPREDSGIVACRRIDEFSKTIAGGGKPTVTEDEARKLASQLAGSDHESLASLGDILRLGFDNDDPRRIEGIRGAMLLASNAHQRCTEAGLSMTIPLPPR